MSALSASKALSKISDSRVEKTSWPPLWVTFAAILCFALLVRVIALDQGLWGDQITVFQIAQLDLKPLVYSVASQEVHPPLSYLLLHGWLQLGGGEVWARLFFVLFGLGTCAVTFALGRALGGRRVGLLAMAVSAVLPSAVWASRYLRSYIVGAFFAGAAAWSFVRLLQGRRSAGDWALYCAFSILAVHTYYFNVLLLAAQGLYGLIVGRHWRKWVAPLLLSQGLAAASLIPLMIIAMKVLNASGVGNPVSTRYVLLNQVGFFVVGVHVGGLIRSITGALGVDTLFLSGPLHRLWPRTLLAAGGFVALATAVGLFWWSCRWLNERGRRVAGVSSGTWVATMLLVPLVVANLVHNLTTLAMVSHYFIPLVPFAACLWAGTIASIPRGWLALVFGGLLVVFCATRLNAIYSDEGANWRSALPYLEDRWQAGDAVVLLEPTLKKGFDFYATRKVPQVGFHPVLADTMKSEAGELGSSGALKRIQSNLDNFQRLWFFRTEPYRFEQERTVVQWVKTQYEPVDEQKFGQIVLTLLIQPQRSSLPVGARPSRAEAVGSL